MSRKRDNSRHISGRNSDVNYILRSAGVKQRDTWVKISCQVAEKNEPHIIKQCYKNITCIIQFSVRLYVCYFGGIIREPNQSSALNLAKNYPSASKLITFSPLRNNLPIKAVDTLATGCTGIARIYDWGPGASIGNANAAKFVLSAYCTVIFPFQACIFFFNFQTGGLTTHSGYANNRMVPYNRSKTMNPTCIPPQN